MISATKSPEAPDQCLIKFFIQSPRGGISVEVDYFYLYFGTVHILSEWAGAVPEVGSVLKQLLLWFIFYFYLYISGDEAAGSKYTCFCFLNLSFPVITSLPLFGLNFTFSLMFNVLLFLYVVLIFYLYFYFSFTCTVFIQFGFKSLGAGSVLNQLA